MFLKIAFMLSKVLTFSRRLIVASMLLMSGLTHANTVTTGWLHNEQHPPVTTRFVLTGEVDTSTARVFGYLEVELQDDWKTYWRTPGEGGIAPEILWDQHKNVDAIDWQWPKPTHYQQLGLDMYGYKHHVVFPITLHLADLHSDVSLSGTIRLSSCTTVCVLTDYPLDLSFNPAGLQASSQESYQFAKAMGQVPQSSSLVSRAKALWDSDQKRLQIEMQKPTGWHQPYVIIDSQQDSLKEYQYKLINQHVVDDVVTLTYEVSTWLGEVDFNQASVTATIDDKDFVAEQTMTVAEGYVDINRIDSSHSLIAMLGFALVGGLILNIMPCVLPVLGLKLNSVLLAKGTSQRRIRFQFLASSLGILVSFWLLAIGLLIVKLTGGAIGWGIQFQSMTFILFMFAVVAGFGANMLGLFEVRLPSKLSTWAASKGDEGYQGHFVQGMFATLLATPCSAPFLGTAVAFALATSTLNMLIIFTALGVGMALPWLAVAIYPRSVSWLPKPGPWMNHLKNLFGFMLLLTSLWLASLLSRHIPVFWIGVLILALFVWIFLGIQRVYGAKSAAVFGGGSIVLLAGSLLVGSMTADKWVSSLPAEPNWHRLDQAQITQWVEEGYVVFVDVTAQWCITCKANKIGVLLQEPVYGALHQPNVKVMQGDWTSPNGTVTDYLRSHQRYGVPLNVVYGPAAPHGIALPVVLSEQQVMAALEKARG